MLWAVPPLADDTWIRITAKVHADSFEQYWIITWIVRGDFKMMSKNKMCREKMTKVFMNVLAQTVECLLYIWKWSIIAKYHVAKRASVVPEVLQCLETTDD